MKLLFTIITAVQHRRRGIVRGLGLFMQGLWCCWTAYLHVNALCMCLLCGSLPASIDMQRSSAAELVTRLRVVSYMSLSTAGLHAGALFELAKKANATAPIDCAHRPSNSSGEGYFGTTMHLTRKQWCDAGAQQHLLPQGCCATFTKLLMRVLQVANLLSQGQATMCQDAVHAIPSLL